MNRYIVHVVFKKAYGMDVLADTEEEARARAEIEAPEMIAKGIARFKHVEYEVYDIFEMSKGTYEDDEE